MGPRLSSTPAQFEYHLLAGCSVHRKSRIIILILLSLLLFPQKPLYFLFKNLLLFCGVNYNFLSGNYPLHLAAWNGNADVAKVLINTGPSRANVNEQASFFPYRFNLSLKAVKLIRQEMECNLKILKLKGAMSAHCYRIHSY